MSEAPKKLWIDPDYLEDETDCISKVKVLDRDIQYIRADIVEEMRKALLGLIADFVINGYTDDDIEKARVALKRLEEE